MCEIVGMWGIHLINSYNSIKNNVPTAVGQAWGAVGHIKNTQRRKDMIIFTGKKIINFDNVKTIDIEERDNGEYAIIANPGGIITKCDTEQEAMQILADMAAVIPVNTRTRGIDITDEE
jgi:hypothetical protein